MCSSDLDQKLNHAVVTILDDEVADPGPWYVEFAKKEFVVSESAGHADITLVRAAGSSEPVAVYWTLGGTATEGVDYKGIWEDGTAGGRGIVHFGDGETIKTFSIPIIGDNLAEGDEDVLLSLSNPTGGPVRGVAKTAKLIIRDDDPLPTITISNATDTIGPDLPRGVYEGPGGGTMHFTITVTGNTDAAHPVKVDWKTFSGTATAPTDFSLSGGTLNFGAVSGSASLEVTVPIIDTPGPEEEERFYVRIGTTVLENAEVKVYEGYGTIFDDDPVNVSGLVFFDINGNGFLDPSTEYGLGGVKVTITDTAGPLFMISRVGVMLPTRFRRG